MAQRPLLVGEMCTLLFVDFFPWICIAHAGSLQLLYVVSVGRQYVALSGPHPRLWISCT